MTRGPQRRSAEGMAERESAYRTYNMALRSGALLRQPCEVCGATGPIHGHHANGYDRPLDVQWLCNQHHAIAHLLSRPSSGVAGPTLSAEREAAGVARKRLARMLLRDTVTVWRWEGMAEVPPAIVDQYRRALAALTEEEDAA